MSRMVTAGGSHCAVFCLMMLAVIASSHGAHPHVSGNTGLGPYLHHRYQQPKGRTQKSTHLTLTVTDHCKVSVEKVVKGTSAPLSRFVPFSAKRSTVLSTVEAEEVEVQPHDFHQWNESHGFNLRDHGMLGLSPDSKYRYMVSFKTSSSSITPVARQQHGEEVEQEFAHMFLDPRLRMADGVHGEHPHPDGHDLFRRSARKVMKVDSEGGEGEEIEAEGEDAKADDIEPVKARFFLHRGGDSEFVWIPDDVDEFNVYCHNASAKIPFSVSALLDGERERQAEAKRAFKAQSGTGQERLVRHADRGPVNTQPNIIFVSGGYNASEEGQFNTTINRILGLLEDANVARGGYNPTTPPTSDGGQNLANQHASVPFDRYWPLFNVYSVFQPSPQSGSSYPGRGITVNDNLGCYHPQTAERAVSCSLSKTIALAAVSPADVYSNPDKAVIIVIVNTKTYGGTGIFRKGRLHVCHFFGGTELNTAGQVEDYESVKYASLINHEVGHAFGNLFDEYDIGISEPTSMKLENCQAPGPGGGPPNPVQWQHWITIMTSPTLKAKYQKGIVDSEWGTASTPILNCGFSNYYKSNPNCMMRAVNKFFMCPVCRETSTMEIMSNKIEYQWPRFPLPDPILVIPDDPSNTLNGGYNTVQSGVMLHLPKMLTSLNDFDVQWYDDRDVSMSTNVVNDAFCPQCLRLSSTLLASYSSRKNSVIEFYANVTDNTNFISTQETASVPTLKQHMRFKIKIVDVGSVSSLTNVTTEDPISQSKAPFGSSSLDSRRTYQQCLWDSPDRTPLCKLSFSGKVYEAPADLEGLVAQYDQWVLYVVGGIAALFLLLWVFAANYYSSKSKNVVRPIFRTEFGGCVSVIRKIMLAASILFMISSLGSMGLSVYVYLEISAVGKVIILAGMVLAIGLYIMAFVGFWAVSYRSKKLVLVNGGFLFFGLLILGAIAVVGVTIGKDIKEDDSFWTKQLEKLWKSIVSSAPENACAIQGMLSCSGFLIACNTNTRSTLYCPVNCEETNARFGTSCKKVLQDYISEHYFTSLSVIFGSIGLMLIAIIFNFYYYSQLKKMKNQIRDQTNKRLQRHASKKNISRRTVDRSKALFILKTLDDGDTAHLIREFRRIDVDGNGELDRSEFLLFFKKALCYKPSPVEIDEIFRVADLDGNGTISLDEFLCIFNPNAINKAASYAPKSASQKQLKAQELALIRRGMTDDRSKEIQRRARSAYGEEEMSQQPAQGQPQYQPQRQLVAPMPQQGGGHAPAPTQRGYTPQGQRGDPRGRAGQQLPAQDLI